MEEITALQNQIGVLQSVIQSLYAHPSTKQLALTLSRNTNTFLHELLIRKMLEKDESGNYLHSEPA